MSLVCNSKLGKLKLKNNTVSKVYRVTSKNGQEENNGVFGLVDIYDISGGRTTELLDALQQRDFMFSIDDRLNVASDLQSLIGLKDDN